MNAIRAVYVLLVLPFVVSITYNPSAPAQLVSCTNTTLPAAGAPLEYVNVIVRELLVAVTSVAACAE